MVLLYNHPCSWPSAVRSSVHHDADGLDYLIARRFSARRVEANASNVLCGVFGRGHILIYKGISKVTAGIDDHIRNGGANEVVEQCISRILRVP